MPAFRSTMSASDALLWNIEQDPMLRTTITVVALLDRAPDWGRLRARLERGIADVPRLRQTVAVSPLRPGAPAWVDDEHFDLHYHLRRVRAPEPGTVRSVLDIAEPIAMAAFDRSRPLWEMTLVEGLADGGAALVMKLHHSFADGVGGIQLALVLLDLERDASIAPVSEPAATEAVRGAPLPRALAHGAAVAARLAARTARDPFGVAREAAALTTSAGRILAPTGAPRSTLLTGRSLARRLDVLEVPLDAVRDAARAAGCSLNAAFLAAAVGGATRYHSKHGVELADLRVTMPVNIRREGDPSAGNRFTPTRFVVPTTIDDPVERMRTLGTIADRWRNEPAIAITDPLAIVLDLLPPRAVTRLFGSMLKGVDLVATNVPGISVPVYLAGAELVRTWALGPSSGAAASISFLSHAGTACIGVVADTAAVDDVGAFATCIADGFDEVVGQAYSCSIRSA